MDLARELPNEEYEAAIDDMHYPCAFCSDPIAKEYHGQCYCAEAPTMRYGNFYCSRKCAKLETAFNALDRASFLRKAIKRIERVETYVHTEHLKALKEAAERTDRVKWR